MPERIIKDQKWPTGHSHQREGDQFSNSRDSLGKEQLCGTVLFLFNLWLIQLLISHILQRTHDNQTIPSACYASLRNSCWNQITATLASFRLTSRRQKHEEEVADRTWRRKDLRRREAELVNVRCQHKEPLARNPNL